MKKIIIYQVLARLWGEGRFSSWGKVDFQYVKDLGADWIWFTGIPRHATGKEFVKGDPGSPYAIEDWKDVNAYLADNQGDRMNEFKNLVKSAHDCGIKVMTDFIPNHLAKDYCGPIPVLGRCDYDWTDTVKVDYSDPRTVGEMAGVLSFWAEAGVDGFRCDMVELVPAESMGSIIGKVKESFPELVFAAEVYDKQNYRRYLDVAGFDLLYDKSGVYDILRGILSGNRSARELSWNWQSLGDMQPNMLNFLENHDEQRICSGRFAGSIDRTWAALAMALLFNKASFLLYFGQELAEDASESEDGRTSIFNWVKVNSIHRLKQSLKDGEICLSPTLKEYREMFRLAHRNAFSNGDVWDLCYCNVTADGFDPDRHFAFIRYDNEEAWLVFCNFSERVCECGIAIPDELRSRCPLPASVKIKAGAFAPAIIRLK